ncbi:MAG: SDR family oxidoreductase [Terricaulis sp.]
MSELSGKAALIVGADEVGRGIAKRFTRAGGDVSIADAPDHLDHMASDILVLNMLGKPVLASLEDQSTSDFGHALERVTAMAATMRAVLPHMRARNNGRIILVGHRYGECVNEGIGPYSTAAAALVGLMRTAAVEWGRWGVTTNLLLPFANTDELRAAHAKRPKIIDIFTGQVPLKRAGDPVEDIGGAALYLASTDGAFLNGQILHADGGQHIAGPVLNPVKYIAAS